MKARLHLSARKHVGDGKFPNRYWISVSNDYYVFDGNVCDWISETGKMNSPAVTSVTIKDFGTFAGALKYIEDNLYLGMQYENFTVNSIFVEDRISGQAWEQTQTLNIARAPIHDSTHKDTKFTEEKMALAGLPFH